VFNSLNCRCPEYEILFLEVLRQVRNSLQYRSGISSTKWYPVVLVLVDVFIDIPGGPKKWNPAFNFGIDIPGGLKSGTPLLILG